MWVSVARRKIESRRSAGIFHCLTARIRALGSSSQGWTVLVSVSILALAFLSLDASKAKASCELGRLMKASKGISFSICSFVKLNAWMTQLHYILLYIERTSPELCWANWIRRGHFKLSSHRTSRLLYVAHTTGCLTSCLGCNVVRTTKWWLTNRIFSSFT